MEVQPINHCGMLLTSNLTMASKPLQLDCSSSNNSTEFRNRKDCCNQWRRCGPFLIVLLVLLATAVIILAILLGLRKESEAETANDSGICFTPKCIQIASRVLSAMNKSVDPCENFYEFACGNWVSSHRIPKDKGSLQPLAISNDELERDVQDILEEPIKDNDLEPIQKAKLFFRSCMDEVKISERGTGPLLSVLEEYGGWPTLKTSEESGTVQLEPILARARQYKKNYVWPVPSGYIVSLNVLNDYKVAGTHAVYFDQTTFFLGGRDVYLTERDSPLLQAYQTYIRNIAIALGADDVIAARDAKEMVDFEIQLANISISLPERRKMTQNYNKMSIKSLAILHPEFDWRVYLSEVFSGTNVSFMDDTEVILWMPKYFSRLFPLLNNTSARTVRNYLAWRILADMESAWTERLQKLRLEFRKVSRGIKQLKSRSKKCTEETNSLLSLATGRMYAERRFGKQDKEEVEKMIGYLDRSFTEIVKTADWMDEETKTKALKKLSSMKALIGFPAYLFNDTYLIEFYANYTIVQEDYLRNLLEIRKYVATDQLNDLKRPTYNRWPMRPAVVNAFYHNGLNAIVFPAGIIRSPYYDRMNPKAMNFGGIGMIIGHEITHGYDATGHSFDENGLLHDWWSKESLENFKSRSQCVVEHYNQFTYPSINLTANGNNTLSENIADIGGTKQGFLAYKTWLKENHYKDIHLPGLDYSHEQIYFINVAQIWCSKYSDAAARRDMMTGAHSLPVFRVLGELRNSYGFADTFQCPKGSYMNPDRKCSLW